MRSTSIIIAAAIVASPAAAQQTQQQQPVRSKPFPTEVPKELTDPANVDRLARMMQALSKAFLELPVGELEAAAEGREPTAADRRKTVRQAGREDDPNFERDLQRQVADSRPMIESSMKALAAALPGMLRVMEPMARELEKATDAMPDPDAPKR